MKLAMTKEQEFIVNEIWILAWNASVQRAKLYKKGLSSEDRKASDFRASVIAYIESDIFKSYKNGCDEEQHYKNIESLITKANTLGNGVLGSDGYKYGVAQKLLNLAVKYMWCLGHIKEPPHCPVDRIVINKTKHKDKINWTEIKKRKPYEDVIKEIKALASA
ncbi:MAG: hypothetical protein MN733_26075 [Nitrososphaera sp.]|nr:hypothetical protein [Nitrososphaera sp.]